MATLKHLTTGLECPLAARHVVGRSRTCQLRIDHPSVSALHAEFTWDGHTWHVRDLGSRNGTFMTGQRLAAGQPTIVAPGVDLGFGAPQSDYRLVEGSAPRLMAFGPDGIRMDDHVLCLPSPEDHDVMIFRDSDERWVIETLQGTRPLDDEECVVARGQPFHVYLPGSVAVTRDPLVSNESPPANALLEFIVSRDGEHVDLRLHHGARVQPIESRAHAFLLLALARARVEDVARDRLPESEQGWMHRDDLLKELAIDDPQLINLWVYRARQQLAQLDVGSVWRVIERREGAGQLRLGVKHVRVIDA